MFWQHGAQKLFGFYGQQAAPFTLLWFVGAAEFLGAIAIALGLLTRPLASILALDMAILYVTQYLPKGFPPITNINGEVACQLFLVASLLVFTGPGRHSVRNDIDPRLQKYFPCSYLLHLLVPLHRRSGKVQPGRLGSAPKMI